MLEKMKISMLLLVITFIEILLLNQKWLRIGKPKKLWQTCYPVKVPHSLVSH